ncbi:MAG: hypothetical protein H0T46_17255, partial [Deltaproteobacteria bacterium]|nr:hypothetical protein [Deltaproteobacteria bacterium]
MRLARGSGFLIVAACVAACGDVPTEVHPPNVPLSFGELVYRVVRTNLTTATTCSLEYVGQLEPHHGDFVRSLDHAISADIRNDLPELVGNTILPVVSNGELPKLVDHIGEALKLLVDDAVDPQRKTLKAIVSLSTSPTLVESSMVTSLAAGALASPKIPAVLHSSRLLMQENTGVALVADDVLGLVTHSESPPAHSCTGLVLDDVQGTLLRTAGFVDDPAYALGAPAWMVRPDSKGNPRVLKDGTGKLPFPFIDNDGDGEADVGPTGRPIDAFGNLIDIPFLGTSGKRDAEGRALSSTGGRIYDYYDVKRSALSFTMQMGADFLAAKVHHQIPAIADAVLGPPITCNDGTTTCRAYSAANHPLADLTHLGLEVLRFGKTAKLVEVLHQLFVMEPEKAEDLLVAAGDVIGALQNSTASITDTAMYDALIGIVPIVRQIFTTSNTTGKSTPHLLVDLIAKMTPAEKAQIEQSLDWMLDYRSLSSRPNPTPVGPLVDYRKNRFYLTGSTWTDNRSGLEQAIELLSYANCGFIGCSQGSFSTSCVAATLLNGSFGDPDDGTVSEWLLSAMSSKTPATVSSLISFIDWLNGFSLPFVCNGAGCALEALGCSSARSDDAAAHIPALKSLANSGGLDWLLPIARVFDEQRQMPALVDIFVYIADDLWKSGEHDRRLDNANSFIRRIEPALLSSAKAGAVVKILAAFDVLHGITVSGSTDRATHLMVDMIDYAIKLRTVNGRLTNVANSDLASELLKVVRTISARLDTANAKGALTNVTKFATSYLTSTTTLPGGRRVLKHNNTRMMFAVGLDAAADLATLPAASQACYIDHFQATSEQYLTSRNFATLVRLAKKVTTSQNAAPVEDWLVSLLRKDALGPILQLAAAAASADVAGEDLSELASWFQKVAKSNQSTALSTLIALDNMVQSDSSGAMIQILRNMVNPGPA